MVSEVLCYAGFGITVYLSNRQQYVTFADISSDYGKTTCDVPQGSVLGPLLFLLYDNDIQNCSLEPCVKLFADDTNVFVHGKSLQEAAAKANKSLPVLSNWFLANKVSLSVDKTSYCISEKGDDKKHDVTYSYVIRILKG